MVVRLLWNNPLYARLPGAVACFSFVLVVVSCAKSLSRGASLDADWLKHEVLLVSRELHRTR